MINSSSQAVLALLIGCCILGQNLTNGIFIRDDEYDASPERANNNNNNPQNFHEVDAFGDDYVDFGAHTGANGAFYWHANYPVEDHDDYFEVDRRRK